MIPISAADIAEAVGGRLVNLEGATMVAGVSVDSRSVNRGDLFVAIVGETHDGHDHVRSAVNAGAVGALVTQASDAPCIVVDDTVVALGRMARALLDRLPHCQVVAITGSSGKTSTKDLVAHVLGSVAETVAPPGSFNNEIGLPTTVLRADADTRFLVMEMGMRGRGHISYLCEIAPPHVAVVTNVGSAHLELLGSREAVAEAKSELVSALDDSGIAVLNHDDELVVGMRSLARGSVMTFGRSPGSNVQAVDVELDDLARPSFTIVAGDERADVRLSLHGAHHVYNALAAAAAGLAVGMSLSDIALGLTDAGATSRWRMEVNPAPSGALIINDAYNANPESMAAALNALADMAEGRTAWAVIGEMRELGPSSVAEHERVGAAVVDLQVDHLIAVGEGARPVYDVAAPQLGEQRTHWVADADSALQLLLPAVGTNDVVLVKASRAIGLESVAEGLLAVTSRKDGDL